MFAILLSLSAWASCLEVSFVFVGQPDCVDVVYEGGRSRVTNRCAEPVLIDQSVQLSADGVPPSPFLGANTSAEIRDLSAFTVGLRGELYRVTATLAEAPRACGDTADTADTGGAGRER